MAEAHDREVEISDDAQSAVSNVTVRSLNSRRARVVRLPNDVDHIMDRLSRLMDEKFIRQERQIQERISQAVENEILGQQILDSQLRGVQTESTPDKGRPTQDETDLAGRQSNPDNQQMQAGAIPKLKLWRSAVIADIKVLQRQRQEAINEMVRLTKDLSIII